MDSSQLPIDIQCSKLVDWILDRRICPREWSKSVLLIRNKINLAIQDMPEHPDITDLLQGSTINYFNCQRIVEILKETEKQSKNIFGMYSSQRMKDWNNIISMYQKNSIYLVEAASFLQRNATYELASVKKQIARNQQLQHECEEKHSALGKSINEINHQLKKFYDELDIKGDNLVVELKDLPNSLGPIYETISNKCKGLHAAIDYYSQFVEHFHKRDPKDVLPYLTYLIKNGNTTVFEWRTGIIPTSVEKKAVEYKFEKSNAADNGAFSIGDEINFDIDDVVLDDDAGDIDWGDSESIGDKKTDNLNVIVDDDALKGCIVVEETGVYIPVDGIAKDDDALTILEFQDTRNSIYHDLIRLYTFMRQRQREISEGENLLVTMIMQDAPKLIRTTTEKEILKYIDLINDAKGYYKSKKLEQLFLIRDSPRYLERVYDRFMQKFKSIDRCLKAQEEMKAKSKDLSDQIVDLNVKLKLFIKKTKELQKHITEDMSKRYNGTRVNIMGEINTY